MLKDKKLIKSTALLTLFIFLFQVIFPLSSTKVLAETPDVNIEWKQRFGGSRTDCFRSVAVTGDGGYIAVGISQSIDHDMSGLHKDSGSGDAIIVKYDNKGNVEWKKSFGGSLGEEFYSVAVTGDGGYIAVGDSYSNDKDMSGLYKGDCDAIIVKYDSKGNVKWKKSFGGSKFDSFRSVAVTGDGGYIAVGESNSNDQDMSGLNKGSFDAIIVKYDSEGNVKWKKSFGGSNNDGFDSVAVTGNEEYIAVGFSPSNDKDMSGLNKGSSDAVIVKYDSEGNVKWKKNFGGSSGDYFNSVAVARDGGYIAVGYSSSNDQDMSGLNKGSSDAVIVKYDSEGNVKWKKSFGGSSYDCFDSVAVTGNEEYIAVGYSSSNDQDMSGLNKGPNDAIIVKYDSEGNVKWKKSFGGSDSDYFESVAVAGNEEYIAVGYSYSNDQDMSGLNKGSRDAIIVKFVSDATVEVTGVSLNETSKTVKIGESFTLIATVSPENATNKNVVWESSNTNVAIVDENGNVTAVGVGTAIITVRTEDGNYEATCEVTVEPIEVTGAKENNYYGFILASAGRDGIFGTEDDIYITAEGNIIKGKSPISKEILLNGCVFSATITGGNNDNSRNNGNSGGN